MHGSVVVFTASVSVQHRQQTATKYADFKIIKVACEFQQRRQTVRLQQTVAVAQRWILLLG